MSFKRIFNTPLSDLSACSAFSASKCPWESDPLGDGAFEQIDEVKNVQGCQYYCRSVFGETCKYFIYRTTTESCFVFNSGEVGSCMQTGGSIAVNVTECNTVFQDRIDSHDCSVCLFSQEYSLSLYTTFIES